MNMPLSPMSDAHAVLHRIPMSCGFAYCSTIPDTPALHHPVNAPLLRSG